jgi:hypothetical protein
VQDQRAQSDPQSQSPAWFDGSQANDVTAGMLSSAHTALTSLAQAPIAISTIARNLSVLWLHLCNDRLQTLQYPQQMYLEIGQQRLLLI